MMSLGLNSRNGEMVEFLFYVKPTSQFFRCIYLINAFPMDNATAGNSLSKSDTREPPTRVGIQLDCYGFWMVYRVMVSRSFLPF